MKLLKSIKENSKGFLISTVILMSSVFIIHKSQFRNPPFLLDILLSKLILAPLLLFALMFFTLILIGGKE